VLNNMGLGFVFTATDLASSKMQALERSFLSLDKRVGLGTERITSSFRELGMGLSLMTAGAAMVGGAFALADKAGKFEQAIAAVAAVSGATKNELAQLREAAIDAGIATQFSPTDATVGLKELAQAGFNAQDSMKLLIPVLDLAGGSLGELTPAQAAGLASQALKAFGLSADEAGVSVDRMLQAVNVFALNASELPQALGIASRGAQALHQSMSETLISLGLVKNIIPGVERASTGVAVAMERMAKPKTQTALKGLGVTVVDSGGHFRGFLDIIGDMVPALGKMTDAKRSAFLIDTFGAHALGSLQAILTQVTTGIKTNSGETLKGADAIAYLRKQFDEAGGTAAGFRDKMLDTFAGQKQLMAGSLETLAIVLGEPFAQVFKPILATVLDGLNGVLKFLRAMPAGLKKSFGSVFVGAGSLIAVVGAALAAKASLALFVIALKAAGVTLTGVLVVLAPAIAAVAALGLAFAGLKLAFEKNLGGFGDLMRRSWERTALFFSAIKQLFEDGGFSGAVREELNRAENLGLKDFLINLFLWGHRIVNFLKGISTGFAAGVESTRPVMEAFVGALTRLGQALGILSARDDATTAAAKFRAFGSSGEQVGRTLAAVFEFIVRGLTAVVDTTRGLVEGWTMMRPAAALVGSAFAVLGNQLALLVGSLNGQATATRENGSAWVALGQVVAFVVSLIVGTLALLVTAIAAAVAVASGVISALVSVFSGLADVVTGVVFIIGGIFAGSWADIWTGMKLVAFGVIDAIAGAILGLVGAIGGAIDAIAGLLGSATGLQGALKGFKETFRADLGNAMGVGDLSFTPTKPQNGPAPASGTPTAATAPMPALAALQAQPAAPAVPAAPPGQAPGPVVVNVQVDGQTVARAVHKAGADSAARSFSPVPTF
jgi:TP901 family phage tail tape measure protein